MSMHNPYNRSFGEHWHRTKAGQRSEGRARTGTAKLPEQGGDITATVDATRASAWSIDGRTFSYWTSAEQPFTPGELVLMRSSDGSAFLGQVFEYSVGPPSEPGVCSATGAGAVLAFLGPDGSPLRGERHSFASATVEQASADHLAAVQHASGADLLIGTQRSGTVAAPARLRSAAFNRHTFLCGQSGSGKTYSLGVILEQLLVSTDLRMVIFDPNADFVGLGSTRADAPATAARRLAEAKLHVLRSASSAGSDGERLRFRFTTTSRRAQAAVLQLDPIADRAEYNTFLHVMGDSDARDVHELVTALLAGGSDERALGQRAENLGLTDWEVWAAERPSAAEIIDTGARVTVMDLGGFHDPLEPLAVSLDVLESLWLRRGSHTPTLLVIDEAHNLCTAEPSGPLHTAVTERLIQIAAEGRKYGLWLLLSTQRPSKIHPQVLTQCDNLVLMRMNSRGDLAELSRVFGFVPESMLMASQFFAQGEALVAGTLAATPAIIRMGARLTAEGGSDVAVPRH